MRRSFLKTHWKSLLIILFLVLIALLTLPPGAASPTLAARLRQHVQAIAPDGQHVPAAARTARYIQDTLAAQGWQVRRVGNGAVPDIEVMQRGGPGRAERSFMVGVHYAGRPGAGTAAVLELARLLSAVRPAPGTQVGFLFLASGGPGQVSPARPGAPPPAAGGFVAFAGTAPASGRMVQALAAFRAGVQSPGRGLAARGWVQGVTLSAQAAPRHAAYPALVVASTDFLDYPYLATAGANAGDAGYQDMARVVAALARTLAALAAGTPG
jgi:hypothetical protein